MVIKAIIKENPLSDCGNIVTGTRFIGRAYEIETIHNRILTTNGGNIAIMGLPRAGKSSLAWKALMEQRNQALEEKILIIRINVGNISFSKEFYQTLINELYDELIIEDFLEEKQEKIINKYKNIIFDSNENNINIKNAINRFYKIIAKIDISVIYILDEFDHIGTIFKLEDFQFLRELSINPDTMVSFITISRRTIQEIELLGNVALSKLSTVFLDLNLGLFNNNEVNIYWKQLEKFGIETDNEYRDKVKYYTGNHPFLIDIFNSEIINKLLIEKNIDIENSIENLIRLTFFNLYDNIITLLKEEKLYDKLIQILFGPRYDLDSKSIERLLKFGIILKDSNNLYQSFSEFFREYLYLKQNEIDFWPLWSETETLLRELIKKELTKKYGQNWESQFIQKYSKKENSIKELRKTMLKNKKNFPEKASTHLLDYTYPKDMYDIFISTEWSTIYCNIFTGKKQDWIKKFELLAKIRNPVAHNNEYFIPDTERNIAINICEEIIGIINKI